MTAAQQFTQPSAQSGHSLAAEVLHSLQADTRDLQSLSLLLLEERHALEQNEQQQISQIAEKKSRLVEQMEQRHQQRIIQLNKQQINDRGDWKTTLQRLESHSQLPLLAQWCEMEKQLLHCREELIVNQRIIDSMQRCTAHFINLLKGQTGFGQTYNAQGATENISSQTPISRA